MTHIQAIVVVCWFLVISSFGSIRIHATIMRANETDRLALLAFKRSIEQDPQGALSSWNDTVHFCMWEGVTCGGPRNQRVTILEFLSRELVGKLSPHLGNLSYLWFLQINDNSLYGEIPPQLGRLSRLKFINFNFNHLEGNIPANLSRCSKLIALGVGGNELVGKIPEELGLLSKLRTFQAFQNNLTGGIPRFLGNLSSLQNLSIAENQLGGSIPNSIGQLTNLSFLQLADLNLSGTVPPSLYNLSSLTLLSMAYNQLQGSIPPNIGLKLPHLGRLHLNDNWFTGILPISLSNCSSLGILELSTNYFNGKITVDFGRLNNLRAIFLGQNFFGSGEPDEMNFVDSAANCSTLFILYLEANKLKGFLPSSVGNLTANLFYLNFEKNLLYGGLPSTIGNLEGLSTLALNDNQFSGTIPTSIGNLAKMERLFLQRNKFSGAIPNSIGKLSMLLELHMEMNQLEGNIPTSLENCKGLLQLELSVNNLSGPIPNHLFRLSALSIALNLSRNHLSGSLALEVGNFKNLGSLDVSGNNLSGEIPSSFSSCTSLENLFVQENTFQGSIPSSFSYLKSLVNLDISHNNLSGRIPRSFETFSMKYLNLSFNSFEGEVPVGGVFANKSAISVFGNERLCGGIPELQLRKCSNKESKRRKGRAHANIIVISVICTLAFVAIVCFFLFCWHKKTKKVKAPGSMLNDGSQFPRVTYEKLLKATNGFSSENLVGKGSYGSVYKGTLDEDEMVIAVKVLNLQSRGGSKSFMIECEILRNARHRNLVKIITSCSSVDFHGNDFKALVYDFMSSGNLEQWLHSSIEDQSELGKIQRLSLLQRINIAIDVACALDYLHHQCENSIIHWDLKPSNILLDGDMVGHVGDFGLAKLLLPELANATQSSSIGLRGTIGYAPPEYGLGSEISTNGDI